MYCLAMMIVCAMGLQNAFGKLYPKETYGPTTMMTGNVTQWALDLKAIPSTTSSFKKISFTITGFLFGCFAGAIAGKFIGLESVVFAGVVLLTTNHFRKP